MLRTQVKFQGNALKSSLSNENADRKNTSISAAEMQTTSSESLSGFGSLSFAQKLLFCNTQAL